MKLDKKFRRWPIKTALLAKLCKMLGKDAHIELYYIGNKTSYKLTSS